MNEPNAMVPELAEFSWVLGGPLAVFLPSLAAAKREGLSLFGTLASDCVLDFDAKWVHRGSARAEEWLGTRDLQSWPIWAAALTWCAGCRWFRLGCRT